MQNSPPSFPHLRHSTGDKESVASDVSDAPAPFPGAGCVANGLTRIGAFKKGNQNKAAKKALNKQIDPVHSKLRNANPALPRSEVGVDDKIWNKEVVQQAVIEEGYHFFREQIDPAHSDRVDLREKFKTGEYLVEGLINPTFLKAGKTAKDAKVKKNWIEHYPGDGEPDETNPNDEWWHMVGVKDGKILDWEFADNGDKLGTSPVYIATQDGGLGHGWQGHFLAAFSFSLGVIHI